MTFARPCRKVWITRSKMLFCDTLMGKNSKTYNTFQVASAIFMILALLWLTVSTPFVFNSQKERSSQQLSANAGTEEETANPFGNTTEEKTPNSSSFSEEYLHDHHGADHFLLIVSQYHKCENSGTYTAFHGELLVRPPNQL